MLMLLNILALVQLLFQKMAKADATSSPTNAHRIWTGSPQSRVSSPCGSASPFLLFLTRTRLQEWEGGTDLLLRCWGDDRALKGSRPCRCGDLRAALAAAPSGDLGGWNCGLVVPPTAGRSRCQHEWQLRDTAAGESWEGAVDSHPLGAACCLPGEGFAIQPFGHRLSRAQRSTSSSRERTDLLRLVVWGQLMGCYSGRTLYCG